MSLKDALKKAIFVQEPDKDINREQATAENAVAPKNNKKEIIFQKVNLPVTTNTGSSANSANGEVNQDIFNELCRIIDENALSTTNYLDLKKNIESLKTILTSVNLNDLIKAAFVNLKSTNPSFSKDTVSSSIDYYIKIIAKQKNDGINILVQQKKEKVDSPLSKIDEIKNTIRDLEKQRDNISLDITNKTNEIHKIQNEVKNQEDILSKKEADLNTTIDYMNKLLVEDKNNILNALSEIK